MRPIAEIYRFTTKNFTVVVDALPEDMSPHDSFDEEIEAEFDTFGKIERGELEWFCARARLLGPTGDELASDYLGGCCYKTFAAFRDNVGIRKHGKNYGSYFSDMVRTVVAEGRAAFADA